MQSVSAAMPDSHRPLAEIRLIPKNWAQVLVFETPMLRAHVAFVNPRP